MIVKKTLNSIATPLEIPLNLHIMLYFFNCFGLTDHPPPISLSLSLSLSLPPPESPLCGGSRDNKHGQSLTYNVDIY